MTLLRGSRVPLKVWFDALPVVAERKSRQQELTAIELQRRYPTELGDIKTARRTKRVLVEEVYGEPLWKGFSFRLAPDGQTIRFQNGGLYIPLGRRPDRRCFYEQDCWYRLVGDSATWPDERRARWWKSILDARRRADF
jgi:hypothetical protein